jgi:hypothetical protein
MLFQASITIPKNTLKADPAEVMLPIAMGVINKIMVRPRPGHASLAHCVILYHEHQIAPSVEDMDFSGDTFPIDWEEQYPVDQPPYELKILGWNEDDTYEHTFDIYVAMLEQAIAARQSTIGGMLAKFLKMVGITS